MQSLDRIESALLTDKAIDETIDEKNLRNYLKRLNSIRIQANAEKIDLEQQIDSSRNQVEALGEASATENKDVTAKRKSLFKEKNTLEKQLSQTRLIIIRAEELIQHVSELQTTLLTQRLFSKGQSIVSLILSSLGTDEFSLDQIKQFIVYNAGIHQIPLSDFVLLLIVLLSATAAGVWLRRRLQHWVSTGTWRTDFTHQFWQALVTTTAHYLPQCLGTTVTAAVCLLISKELAPLPLISVFIIALPLFYFSLLVITTFLTPKKPARHFLPIGSELTVKIARALRIVLLMIFIAVIVLFTLRIQEISMSLQLLTRDIFSLVIVSNLAWVIWLAGLGTENNKVRWVRIGLLVTLFVIIVAELIGYRNLAATIFRIAISLLVVFGATLLVSRLFREFYDALDQGKQHWHKPVRKALGLKAGQHIPGLSGVRFTTSFIIWVFFVAAIAQILGLSDTIVNQAKTIAIDGFTFGSLNINPARILMAVMIFALLFTASSWFKVKLDKSWLVRTRIERGAREALITISGYIGISIAVLVALGVAGFTFTNLAIIAGALSVGIGFGLQNIVNNFVSGLILLFERPIRKGDWIVVGNTEGYVKNISIRSTQIQTFDRADVIVPNSDLISNQVTNWMLHDQSGRVRVAVGVAYGSDTEKVREILNNIAVADERVIKNNPNYKIRVLFLAFGDSALNFELRFHIKNIDEKLLVTSDINFAINKAFNEHNIEIPFPQRDIHIKSNATEKLATK